MAFPFLVAGLAAVACAGPAISLASQVLLAFSLVILWAHVPMLHALWIYRNIPGPRPWPLVGNLPALVKGNLHLVYLDFERQFGPCFKIFVGFQVVLVYSDVDSVREIGLRKFSVFTNRPSPPEKVLSLLNERQRESQQYGILGAKDAYWKGVRSTSHSIFHSVETLASFCPLMKETASELVERLAEVKEGEAIDIWRAFGDMTLDVIGSTVFGVRFNSVRSKGADAVKAARIVFANSGPFGSNPYMVIAGVAPSFMTPVLKLLASRFPTQGMRENQWAVAFLNDVSDEMYELAQKENNNNNDGKIEASSEADSSPAGMPSSYDFTGNSFLKLFINGHSRVTGESLKKVEVVSQAFIFLLAGYETTANTLAQTVYLLCKHKDKERVLINEIDRLEQQEEEETSSELKSHVYVEACVKEALRMVGPGAFLARLASRDTEVGKRCIAKDTPLHMHTHSMHHNPQYFPSPSTFMPERFIPGSEVYELQNHKAFMPFGLGPRMCVAWNFAMAEAKLALITLYRKYSFEHNPKHEYKNSLSITLSPVNGIEVLVHKRK
jgi:cytochrome P450